MPELPEVETVRRGLEGAIVGRRIDEVQVPGRRTVRRQSPAELEIRLIGRSFTAAGRRGKFLLLSLDDDAVLVIHLRMTGQLLHVRSRKSPPLEAHTQVVMKLGDGTELRFVDPRTFGEWFVSHEIDSRGIPAELAHLGRDPLLEGLPARYLVDRLAGRRASLKALLTDQRIVAGIGSIYADEICFRARLRPDRAGGSLSAPEVASLARAARAVLAEAVRSAVPPCGTCATAISREGWARFRAVTPSTTVKVSPAGGAAAASCGSRSVPGPPTAARAASYRANSPREDQGCASIPDD